ncbi:xenobiotic reductase A, partial [Pseudomonas syringae pv. actinidiae ICMP 18804]
MSALFEPFKLKDVTLRNRIAIPPMCQYSAIDGVANDWHHVHLASMARGGAGLLVVEATAVAPEGRITPGCTGIWNDEQAQAFV